MGGTWQLTDNTTLRAYAAEGFGLPSLVTLGSLQKVRTIQGGIESGALPYLWLKGTWFYNILRNSQSSAAAASDQNRQGFEVEARTTPLYNLSLATGYTYLYATDTASGARLQTDSSNTVPPHTVKLALNYDKTDLGLRGTLTGNYVWWNAAATTMAANRGMVWDLHLNWKISPKSDLSPELFFSGHNLFNNVLTTDTEIFTNAMRWFEGGVRVRF
jgi:vitamin B12 transporter